MAIDHLVASGSSSVRPAPREATLEPSPISGTRATGASLALLLATDRLQGCLLEYVSGIYRLVAWSSLPPAPGQDLPTQLSRLCHKIGSQINRTLWDDSSDSPFVQSTDRVRYPPLDYVTVVASPLPLLRTWLIALSPTHSMRAAEQAIAAAPAHIVGRTALDAALNPTTLTPALLEARPDIIVVVGGYDTTSQVAQQPIRHLTTLVKNILQTIPQEIRPFLLFAGNQWVDADFEQQLGDGQGLAMQSIPNVMPAAGITRQAALAHTLDNYYQYTCRELGGATQISQWITSPARVASVESFFVRLVHVWMMANNLSDLHALYCAADRWVHVWTTAGTPEIRIQYAQPGHSTPSLHGWPNIELLSGPWASGHGPRPQITWWDRAGMAPAIAPIGQFSPAAMLQVLEADVLLRSRTRPRRSMR